MYRSTNKEANHYLPCLKPEGETKKTDNQVKAHWTSLNHSQRGELLYAGGSFRNSKATILELFYLGIAEHGTSATQWDWNYWILLQTRGISIQIRWHIH